LSAIAGFVGFLGLAVFASWLAFSLGRWLGTREAQRDDREHDAPVGSVVAATLGLLAFTLAMAFNMAHTKHSGRKALVREDVKAIQMAYDRAMLLPPEATKSAHEKLVEYARIRAFDTFSQADVPLELIIRRSEEIQHELWLQAVAHREHTNVRFYMDAWIKARCYASQTPCKANNGSEGHFSKRRIARKPSRVVFLVPEERVERVHALEVEPNVMLVRDADTAVQL
jgi:hypothetical protein